MLHATATVLAASTTASTSALLTPNDIAALICIPLFVLFVVWRVKSSKKKKQRKANGGFYSKLKCEHVTGLPIPDKTKCDITTYADRVDFKAGTTEISLQRSKITDMCIKTSTEIQKQAVSSVGGAIAGGLVFGPLGAIVGGRSKTKDISVNTKYLVITYLGENNELKYVCFDVEYCIHDAKKIVKEFEELNVNSNVHIEL